MRNLKLRVALVLIFLTTTAVASPLWLYPTRMERGSNRAASIPMMVGDYIGREIPISKEIMADLETDDLIQRDYTSPDDRTATELAVVFSADNRRVAHPPEVCYRGAGWEVMNKQVVEIEGLPPMVRLVLANGPARDIVMYCFKSGDDITASYAQQQINIIANTLRRKTMASALLRFSSEIKQSEGIDGAQERVARLAKVLFPEIRKALDGPAKPQVVAAAAVGE